MAYSGMSMKGCERVEWLMCTFLSNEELYEIGKYMIYNGWPTVYDLEESWLINDVQCKFTSAELLSYWYKVKALIASSDKPRHAKVTWTAGQFETDDKIPSIDLIREHVRDAAFFKQDPDQFCCELAVETMFQSIRNKPSIVKPWIFEYTGNIDESDEENMLTETLSLQDIKNRIVSNTDMLANNYELIGLIARYCGEKYAAAQIYKNKVLVHRNGEDYLEVLDTIACTCSLAHMVVQETGNANAVYAKHFPNASPRRRRQR